MDQIKEYDWEGMSIEEIADVGSNLNALKAACEKQLELAKTVVKARYRDKEIPNKIVTAIGSLEIRESDEFHPILAADAFESMKRVGLSEADFLKVCTVNLNDSKTKKTLGLLHFLSAADVEKIRTKKREKSLTIYFKKI